MSWLEVISRRALVNVINKKASTIAKAAAVATVILVGYVFLVSLPDLRRYIKISRM
jgi:hypothetical protein